MYWCWWISINHRQFWQRINSQATCDGAQPHITITICAVSFSASIQFMIPPQHTKQQLSSRKQSEDSLLIILLLPKECTGQADKSTKRIVRRIIKRKQLSTATKMASTQVVAANNMSPSNPTKKLQIDIVAAINMRMGTKISYKSVSQMVRAGQVEVSTAKPGPVGSFNKVEHDVTKADFLSYIKLEQAIGKKQLTIKQLDFRLNSMVNYSGQMNRKGDELAKRLMKDVPDKLCCQETQSTRTATHSLDALCQLESLVRPMGRPSYWPRIWPLRLRDLPIIPLKLASAWYQPTGGEMALVFRRTVQVVLWLFTVIVLGSNSNTKCYCRTWYKFYRTMILSVGGSHIRTKFEVQIDKDLKKWCRTNTSKKYKLGKKAKTTIFTCN